MIKVCLGLIIIGGLIYMYRAEKNEKTEKKEGFEIPKFMK